MIQKFIACLLLLSVAYNLQVAVSSMQHRCMVVYTVSQQDHLKIDIKFPKIRTKVDKQYYEILLQNTETEVKETFTIEEGTFRKQIMLTENVVYKICIKIMLSQNPRQQALEYIDYNTGIKHSANIYETKLQIPPNLLKISDLHNSYKELIVFQESIQQLNETKMSNRQYSDQIFTQQNQKIQKIQFISYIELAIVCVLGGYQYFRLKGLIESRHA